MIIGLPEIELFAQGHRSCAGCGSALTMRYVLKATGKDTIVVQNTGCLEVTTTPFPETAWEVPYIHVAFECGAAVASGVERALKKLNKKANIIVFGGDGGTFDIGFQALSGMIERGHKICYVCNDNEAYQNTGIQRSGSTPKYASTTTSPFGSKIHGKQELKKPLPFIIAAHRLPYVATASIAYPQDVVKKVQTALSQDGPTYLQVFSPCVPGWKYDPSQTVAIAKLAVETGVTPLYEILHGKLSLRKIENRKPVKDYYSAQGRFKGMNDKELEEVQKYV
ncbi:pyruvate synthase subunit beta, partial [Candidatus Woesearchaeota archaeon]|nr:pyruvate synthase subunit beta [Candidatus Woesearchaeota archaeon]